MTSEKWFSIKQQHIENEYNNSLAGNTKPPSPVTPHFNFGVENVSQAIILMLLKLISKWVWGLFDFWKWFSIKQQLIESEYDISLARNTKPPSQVTLHILLVLKMYNKQ